MTGQRLAALAGTRLDRTRRLSFKFNGRPYDGFHGDTLASALLASGTQLVGRSFKLHRPRGIFSCGIEEPNAVVDVVGHGRRTPNVRATMLELTEGMITESVNCWPSVRFDVGAINSWFSRALPAGFYYKTFKWPNWHFFEPSIRRMAGLGRGAKEADLDRYEEVSAAVDVLVVGGGLAGLTAAIAACEAGANVILLSGAPQLGGALGWRSDPAIAALIGTAKRLNIRILSRTVAFGLYDHNLVSVRQELRSPQGSVDGCLRERLWKIRARTVITATGAFERPMVFPDNDRPGVMLAGAVEKYATAYGVACGSRVVIAANGDRAYTVAGSLQRLGIEVVAIVDCRPESAIDRSTGMASSTVPVYSDSVIRAVTGTMAVTACTVAPASSAGAKPTHLDCDLILSAGGFAPAVHLHSHAGGKLRWLADSSMFVPDGPAPGIVSVGACAGVFTAASVMEHASAVGRAVACGSPAPSAPIGGAGRSLANTCVQRSGAKQFIDLQNDVTADDVALAARENYRSVEHLKRYTTTGMGTDQGKTSNINALVLMGEHTQRSPPEVGTTKFRPPFAPITLGTIAGRRVGHLYRPLKRLPAQAWHEARGAMFEEYGGWWRPAAYPQPGESVEAAALREAAATRKGLGLFDGSPLGKLEVFGPDAARFLDLMYVGTMSTLAEGQARYGVLLNENGVVADDGIVARLGADHFWVNTSSGGAERTTAAFEEWLQCEFVDLKVLVTSVTSRWANITVAGPRAWEMLAAAGFPSELSPPQMRHMTIRDAQLEGVPIRVLRASFSGELGYEVNLPCDQSVDLFARLWEVATRFNAQPYGIEALQIMRVEKGYIHIGTDTDGTTLPGDIGLARAVERKAANFVGRRSLTRSAALDPNRLQLVGLVAADGKAALPVGAQIAQLQPPTITEGHVTSSVMSVELGHPVALAMLARGSVRTGDVVRVRHLGASFEAKVVKTPFVDPAGSRLHG